MSDKYLNIINAIMSHTYQRPHIVEKFSLPLLKCGFIFIQSCKIFKIFSIAKKLIYYWSKQNNLNKFMHQYI